MKRILEIPSIDFQSGFEGNENNLGSWPHFMADKFA